MDAHVSDPLNVFVALEEFRRCLEDMICQESEHRPDCHCAILLRLYGSRTYHCDQHFCYAYKKGFDSKTTRDQHSKIYQRTHKCPELNCVFAEIGFHSLGELNKHNSQAHPSQKPSDHLLDGHGSSDLSRMPLADRVQVLRDAVTEDRLDYVNELVNAQNVHEYGHIIINIAVHKASPAMLSLLLDLTKWPYLQLLAVALETRNLPNIKLLLSRGADMSTEGFFGQKISDEKYSDPRIRGSTIVETGYIRALSSWDSTLMRYLVNECHVVIPSVLKHVGNIFANPAIQGDTYEEAITRFNEIKQWIPWPEAYTEGLKQAILYGIVASVRICVENGADVNVRDRKTGLLQKAIMRIRSVKSSERMSCVKLLLQYGAKPNDKDSVVSVPKGKEKQIFRGIEHVEEYFGCPWDEIVSRIEGGEDPVAK